MDIMEEDKDLLTIGQVLLEEEEVMFEQEAHILKELLWPEVEDLDIVRTINILITLQEVMVDLKVIIGIIKVEKVVMLDLCYLEILKEIVVVEQVRLIFMCQINMLVLVVVVLILVEVVLIMVLGHQHLTVHYFKVVLVWLVVEVDIMEAEELLHIHHLNMVTLVEEVQVGQVALNHLTALEGVLEVVTVK